MQLTEEYLHRVVSESIDKVLSESTDEGMFGGLSALGGGIGTVTRERYAQPIAATMTRDNVRRYSREKLNGATDRVLNLLKSINGSIQQGTKGVKEIGSAALRGDLDKRELYNRYCDFANRMCQDDPSDYEEYDGDEIDDDDSQFNFFSRR